MFRCPTLTMEGPSLVIGISFEVFEEVGLEDVRASKIGSYDGEQPPPPLTRVWDDGLVGGGLLHDLTVQLVTKGLELVTILGGEKGL